MSCDHFARRPAAFQQAEPGLHCSSSFTSGSASVDDGVFVEKCNSGSGSQVEDVDMADSDDEMLLNSVTEIANAMLCGSSSGSGSGSSGVDDIAGIGISQQAQAQPAPSANLYTRYDLEWRSVV